MEGVALVGTSRPRGPSGDAVDNTKTKKGRTDEAEAQSASDEQSLSKKNMLTCAKAGAEALKMVRNLNATVFSTFIFDQNAVSEAVSDAGRK